mmetsp:Transcript_83145/g.178247  ORF Transcript_83145/g.178247 Transcript_83145/m.178247 type:complete len:278 (+) Transcript_83145:93-926(+)
MRSHATAHGHDLIQLKSASCIGPRRGGGITGYKRSGEGVSATQQIGTVGVLIAEEHTEGLRFEQGPAGDGVRGLPGNFDGLEATLHSAASSGQRQRGWPPGGNWCGAVALSLAVTFSFGTCWIGDGCPATTIESGGGVGVWSSLQGPKQSWSPCGVAGGGEACSVPVQSMWARQPKSCGRASALFQSIGAADVGGMSCSAKRRRTMPEDSVWCTGERPSLGVGGRGNGAKSHAESYSCKRRRHSESCRSNWRFEMWARGSGVTGCSSSRESTGTSSM